MARMIMKQRALLIVFRHKGLLNKIKSKSVSLKWKPSKCRVTYSVSAQRPNIFTILKVIWWKVQLKDSLRTLTGWTLLYWSCFPFYWYKISNLVAWTRACSKRYQRALFEKTKGYIIIFAASEWEKNVELFVYFYWFFDN